MKRVSTDPGKYARSSAPGRPVSNVGKYLLRPTTREDSGYTLLNATPEVMQQAKQTYLAKYELPPGLAPQGLRRPVPEVLAKKKAMSISKGFVNPKSHQV